MMKTAKVQAVCLLVALTVLAPLAFADRPGDKVLAKNFYRLVVDLLLREEGKEATGRPSGVNKSMERHLLGVTMVVKKFLDDFYSASEQSIMRSRASALKEGETLGSLFLGADCFISRQGSGLPSLFTETMIQLIESYPIFHQQGLQRAFRAVYRGLAICPPVDPHFVESALLKWVKVFRPFQEVSDANLEWFYGQTMTSKARRFEETFRALESPDFRASLERFKPEARLKLKGGIRR